MSTSRAKRQQKQYKDYHSSDYGNEEEEDYGQDYEDDVDDFEQNDDRRGGASRRGPGQRGGADQDARGPRRNSDDSDYGNEGGPRGKKRGAKNDDKMEDDNDDTYDDEDPFSPDIDLILADKQVQVALPPPPPIQPSGRGSRVPPQPPMPQFKIQNVFLVKFVEQSYLHVKWMEETQLEEYSYKAKQKIRRYWAQKEKKRFLSEQLARQAIQFKNPPIIKEVKGQIRKPKAESIAGGLGVGMNHHFSDDDEEEEPIGVLADVDALELPLPVPIDQAEGAEALQMAAQIQRPQFLSVTGPEGEDLTIYFEKIYVGVERILSTTQIFPVIHPRQAKQVRGRWQEDCLKVVNVLINYRKNSVCIGLAFAEQLDQDNADLKDYFKIVKQPMDFIMIMNRLYNRTYEHPNQFWSDLGLVFKNCRAYNKSTKLALRKQCEILRCLAFHLYNDWHNEQMTRFTTGIAIPAPPPPVSTKRTGEDLALDTPNQVQNPEQPKLAGNQQVAPSQMPQQIKTEPQASTKINLSLLSQRKQQEAAPVNQPPQVKSVDTSQQNQDVLQHQALALQQHNTQANQFQAPLPKLNPMMGGAQHGMGQQADVMGLQQHNQMEQMLMQQNQLNSLQQNTMFGGGGANQNQGMLPSISQMQLPSISQMNQGMLLQQQMRGLGGQNPFMNNNAQMLALQNQIMNPQQQLSTVMSNPMVEMQLQIIQQQNISQQDKQYLATQFIEQQLAQHTQNLNNQLLALMGGGQDFAMQQMLNNMRGQGLGGLHGLNQGLGGQGQLPSMSQLQGFNQMGQHGLQLPSMAQLGGAGLMSSNMNSMDPYSMNQQMQLMNQINQRGSQGGRSTGMSTHNMDEMSLMMSMQGGNPNSFNNFNQQPQMMGPNGMGGYGGMQGQMQGHGGFNQKQLINRGGKPQMQQMIDPNMIDQGDNQGNDRNEQYAPVIPCIMDPGEYNLSWLLDGPNERPEDLRTSPYLSDSEIQDAIKNKHYVDQLYLVKWRGLSYSQATWEPESLIKDLFEDRIQDYQKYNRSLDQFQRDRLDHLIRNHKKMLRFTEKKYQGQGKRIDPQQENMLSLQEARMNRQLLNLKIQEIMGNMYYQVVQYNEANGVVPKFKKPHQKLKDYQVVGLNWLIRAWHEHRNVVLADEMGLGKTIMTLSLFDHLAKVNKLRGPFLILAPLTTLEHWKRIADEWTSLNTVLYYDPGSAEGREHIRQWEWYYTDITYKGTITQKSELFKFNVMITSFEVFMSDLNPIMQQIPFVYIVVDEAHRLKNKQAKTLKLLKDHPCKRILLLTGTPVQNNTKELWTLLNYIEPEKFSNMDQFLEQYGNLESYEQIQKLHTILKPHFLRRMKDEVENSIPPLNETVVEVGLTSLQNTYYKGIYGENRMVLAKFGTNSIKTSQLNNMDVQLRKCCNHLFLLKGVEEELTRDCKTEEDLYNKLLESSGKLMLLDKFIEKFKKENHKMLIFSQFKRMLDIIELYLKMKGVPYEKLTGSVKTQDRISAIQRFNDDQKPSGEGGGNGFGVFLLTTRAGGLGITLTSARVVIIFDSDWNPQNDLQAIARAHRIGQKFEVQVYRLITSKSYEEQMFERASKKLGMEQALFSKGAFNPGMDADQANPLEGGLQLRSLTDFKQDSKEIENLLKYGAYAFMVDDKEQDEEEKELRNKDIDEILATGRKKEFSYNKGVYTLQKSTFNASKYEKALPDFDDPDYWNKVLPMQSLISISMLEKKFKKEKKEIAKNEKDQREFIKDLEVVFNDFMELKFDKCMTTASKKTFEEDEETLRELLKKMVKLSGMKLMYVEKCKEWLREMLRTSKRKKPLQTLAQADKVAQGIVDDEDDEAAAEEDDIIMYDSDNGDRRPVRKRTEVEEALKKREKKALSKEEEGAEGDNEEIEDINILNAEDAEEAEAIAAGQRRSLRARKAAPGKGAALGEAHFAEGEFEAYGAEDGDDYGLDRKGGKRRSARQQLNAAKDDDGDMSGEEARYGLRGRKKRVKMMEGKGAIDSMGDSSARHYAAQSSGHFDRDLSLNHQTSSRGQLGASSMYHIIGKRNEKNGIVCSYCMHPESKEAPCNLFCQSYCQRSFHENCKDALYPEVTFADQQPDDSPTQKAKAQRKAQVLAQMEAKGLWQCEDCIENVAECFCCKKKGLILVFPKKGKPKAPGSANQINEGQLNGNGDDKGEDDDQIVEEDLDIQRELLSQNSSDHSKEEIQQPVKIEEEPVVAGIEEQKKQEEPVCLPKLENLDEEREPQADQDESPSPLANQPFSPDEPDPNDPKYVVRCTLGGCFKYYHVKCVYKNKNVSCINSMKVQRFRCPLHYCEICQASGDSVLIVQCVACPTAYHVKCMPRGDPNAIRLTKKYVVCKRHNMNADDFPKFEEKAATTTNLAHQRSTLSSSQMVPEFVGQQSMTMSGGASVSTPLVLGENGKPPPKKRGRKPKSHHLAQEEAQRQLVLAQQREQAELQKKHEIVKLEQQEEQKQPFIPPVIAQQVHPQQRPLIIQPPLHMSSSHHNNNQHPMLLDEDDDDDLALMDDMRMGRGIDMDDDDEDDDDEFGLSKYNAPNMHHMHPRKE